MDNPLKNIELETWPDFLLAIAGLAFIISLTSLLSGSAVAAPTTLIFSGIFSFGVGGKISYYRFRDSNIKRNKNAWFSGWRHSLLADSFAVIGVVLIIIGLAIIYNQYA
jgi:hypothetical protein